MKTTKTDKENFLLTKKFSTFFSLKCCLLSMFCMLSFISKAQNNTNNKTVLPDSVIEQKLVALALDGPTAKEAEHQIKVNEYTLKGAKNTWMNLLTVSGNYNDQTFAKQNPNNPVIYPKVFFGLTLPIGTLFSRTQVKAAKEGVEIGKLNQEETRRSIKADILSKYKQYKAQGELITIETGFMNDLQVTFTQAEDKFKKNAISFDVYNIAQKNRNDQQSKLINLRLQQDLTRLEIERIIGVDLESVLNNISQ